MKRSEEPVTYIDEFHVTNTGEAYDAGNAIVVNDSLYYFVATDDKRLKLLVAKLQDLQNSKSLSSLKKKENWSCFLLKSEIITEKYDSDDYNLKSRYRPGIVSSNNVIYLFWVDDKKSTLCMAKITPSKSTSELICPNIYTIQVNGSNLSIHSYISVSMAPDGVTIILNYFEEDYDNYSLNTLLLNPDEIEETQDCYYWAAQKKDNIILSNYFNNIDDDYHHISNIWFATGDVTSQGDHGNVMLLSMYSTENKVVKFLAYLIEMDGTPKTRVPPEIIGDLDASKGFSLTRDPAGRVFGIYCNPDDDDKLYWRVLPTFTKSLDDNDNLIVPRNLAWGDGNKLNNLDHNSKKCPTAAFIPGNLSGEPDDDSDYEFPWYIIAFYADKNKEDGPAYDIQLQIACYGMSKIIHGIVNYEDNSSQSEGNSSQYKGILGLIMESFPFPNENLPHSWPSNSPVITYSYGVDKTNTVSIERSFDLRFGIRSEYTTTAGIGAAMESEFETGPSGASTKSKIEMLSKEYSVNTTAGEDMLISSSAPGFYRSYPVLREDRAQFYNAQNFFKLNNDENTSGVTAPIYGMLTPVHSNLDVTAAFDYTTYYCTPGNIESYTADAINNKMYKLYNGLTEDKRQELVAENTDLANAYKNKTYCDYVLTNMIQSLSDTNYVEFTLSGSGTILPDYKSIDTSMNLSSWNVNTSSYVGVSGGIGTSVSAFGISVNTSGFQFKLMAGISYNASIGLRSESSTSWGLHIDTAHMPSNVSGSKSYTVRLYILKPDALWQRELKFFGNVSNYNFDGSAPSRIFFVATHIDGTDYNINTTEDSTLEAPTGFHVKM